MPGLDRGRHCDTSACDRDHCQRPCTDALTTMLMELDDVQATVATNITEAIAAEKAARLQGEKEMEERLKEMGNKLAAAEAARGQ